MVRISLTMKKKLFSKWIFNTIAQKNLFGVHGSLIELNILAWLLAIFRFSTHIWILNDYNLFFMSVGFYLNLFNFWKWPQAVKRNSSTLNSIVAQLPTYLYWTTFRKGYLRLTEGHLHLNAITDFKCVAA